MWMKVDDGLHAHRKTRAVTKSHPEKRRDAAPMGLWVLAGSWAALHRTDGWVPEEELDRWDDDWPALVERLVRAGYWWPQARDAEQGYGFTDWHDYNDPADIASKSGTFGNHVRWHVNEGRVEPECEHCPSEPDRGDIPPDSGGDRGAIGGDTGLDQLSDTTQPLTPVSAQVRSGLSGGDSGGDSRIPSPPIALPEPEPEPEPDPNPRTTSSDESDHTPPSFDEFWDTYGNKVGRKKCETAYRNALKKPGVTADLLISTASAYVLWCRETDTFIKNPLTWLHGEHWRDERPARQAPTSNLQQHLALVHQLGPETPSQFQIGGPAS